MVIFTRPRFAKYYSLNCRHNGQSRTQVRKTLLLRMVGVLAATMAIEAEDDGNPDDFADMLANACFRQYLARVQPIRVQNPVFIRSYRLTATFTDAELYSIRITCRSHVPRLVRVLFPLNTFRTRRLKVDNGCVMDIEECLLMFLWWIAFPRRLFNMQTMWGLEYSQISRFMKGMWLYLNGAWGQKVTSNLAYFVPRFPYYNSKIIDRYTAVHNVAAIDPKFQHAAIFSDPTKRRCNKGRRTNYSGHKKMHCYGFMVSTAPDGLIVDLQGAYAGRKNDHMVQNESLISMRLVAAQAGNVIVYETTSDKGLHNQPCVVPMYNNVVNTAAQTLSNRMWATLRVSNEQTIGIVNNMWRYCDFPKVLNSSKQPLGLFYRVCCLLSNAITCLAPTLEEYFV